MSCFPCFSSKRSESRKEPPLTENAEQDEFDNTQKNTNVPIQNSNAPAQTDVGNESNGVKTFTFRELATATKNFRPDYVLGEGGFGRVYKGSLENSGQTVAIKQLDKNGLNKDFLTEVNKLCLLHHQNLANMIGYCADGDQRLLVYEFIPLGSLEKHLLDLPSSQQPLSWLARIKIAYGAAQGLEYLHEKANPPVIYRDLKSSNILLDEDFTPKLSDFGLSRLGQMGELMGSYGYSGPECTSSGQLSVKADVYAFGVLMLELITGRRVIDTTKPTHEQNLVSWATPMFKDQKRYPELLDPLLDGEFNLKELNQLVAVAAMCLQEESAVRPLMTDVVMTLSFLTTGSGPTADHGSSGD
ncbi:probable serine/threonine-protein kinase PBL24 [Zingiber officinale]|uniref:Protein kinase domain-containing protein n=1 Tax=Zingiber officinale TaxID=94328 RepID=A0A8J5H6Y8_ZINOF|nr:probable serine/threonine-protein kinase PBL24 [Zingiber officinale]KAG6516907.1 hypothetical protein ZIOFF_020282 [Zingiber officinale]